MRYPSRRIAQTAVLGCCTPLFSIAAPAASSLTGDAIESGVAFELDAMSNYLGRLKGFSVAHHIDTDVVSDDAEKLRFASSFVPLARREGTLRDPD